MHADEYEEHLSSTQYTRFQSENPCKDGETDNTLNDDRWPTATEKDASGPAELIQSLRSLWYYHQDVYAFHAHFLNCSEHTYASKPSGWLFINRPVGVAADTNIQPGTRGCDAPAGSDCLRQVLLIGTPMIWWAGILALLYAAAMWVGGRDWRFGLAVVGAGSTWLPWLMYDDRPIFFFYAIATLPFMIIALTLAIGKLIGTSTPALDAAYRRRDRGRLVRGAGRGQLRLVLADLDQRPAHQVGVARPDLVPPMDLEDTDVTSWRPGWDDFPRPAGLLDRTPPVHPDHAACRRLARTSCRWASRSTSRSSARG